LGTFLYVRNPKACLDLCHDGGDDVYTVTPACNGISKNLIMF